MSSLPTIIIPDVRGGEIKPQQDPAEFYRIWREDYAAGRETIPPPENIHVVHDIHWRERPLSMEMIRAAQGDKADWSRPATWFWAGIGLLFWLGDTVWFAWSNGGRAIWR